MKISIQISLIFAVTLSLVLSGCGENDTSSTPVVVDTGGQVLTNDDTTGDPTPQDSGSGQGIPTGCATAACVPTTGTPPILIPPRSQQPYVELQILAGMTRQFQLGLQSYIVTATAVENPGPIQCVTVPCNQPVGFVNLDVEIQGGCGPYPQPGCIGVPSVFFEVQLSELNSTQINGNIQFQLIQLVGSQAHIVVQQL